MSHRVKHVLDLASHPVQLNPDPPGYVDQTSIAAGHYGKPYILNRVFNLLILMIDVLQRSAAAQANRLNFLTEWQKAYTDELNSIHSFTGGNGDQDATQTLQQAVTQQNNDVAIAENNSNPAAVRAAAAVGAIAETTYIDDVIPKGENYNGGSTTGGLNTISLKDSPSKVVSTFGNPVAGSVRGELNSLNSIYTQQIQGNLNVISNDAKALQSNVNESNDAVQSQSDMATSILQQMSTILTSIYQAA